MPEEKEKKVESKHRSVLLNEIIEGLNLGENSEVKRIIIDGTFGGGGHSSEICKRYKNIKILALDQDKSAFEKAKSKFNGGKFKTNKCDIVFINENFRNIDKAIKEEGIEKVDGIILDLGLSTDQLENSERGFTFLKDEPLLMTMKENPGDEDLTATDIVNHWREENLADIIYGYGEEKQSRRIAKGIVDHRQKGHRAKIETTFQLVKIIEEAIPAKWRKGKIHFATKTFQALRIAVNDELGALSEGLDKGFKSLKVGGRMGVISFHSLEDRVVKRFYKLKEEEGVAKIVNKKVITSGESEIKSNPRARSAKLRIIERIN
ncbi:MAG: 16S rRNA (cytosine(1402)-N(4))-methyltransferase RsmH [Candidatus Paceibacterota bacterium]